MMVRMCANGTGLRLLLAKGSRMTKAAALFELSGFGG